MTPNSGDAQENLVRQERLATLGKLAAGLAHELNNPAAAAARAAAALQQAAHAMKETALEHDERFSAADRDAIRAFIAQCRSQGLALELAPLERADREDRIARWLESRGVADASTLAPGFVEVGIDESHLVTLGGQLQAASLSAAMGYMAMSLGIRQLVAEVEQSARRISEVARAMKKFTFVDATARQTVDVNRSLEGTLTIFGYRLRQANVVVRRELADGLPRLRAYPGELNQVWTNLIDNAIDAMPHGGTLTLRTRVDGRWLRVEITDSGVGIPADVLPRIFEPFFTTKPVGLGSGLGLDISWRIVTQMHAGTMVVRSQPGETTFEVSLPLDQP